MPSSDPTPGLDTLPWWAWVLILFCLWLLSAIVHGIFSKVFAEKRLKEEREEIAAQIKFQQWMKKMKDKDELQKKHQEGSEGSSSTGAGFKKRQQIQQQQNPYNASGAGEGEEDDEPQVQGERRTEVQHGFQVF